MKFSNSNVIENVLSYEYIDSITYILNHKSKNASSLKRLHINCLKLKMKLSNVNKNQS